MFGRNRHTTESVSVETDLSDALRYLESLGAHRDKTMRRMLSGIGTAAKNQVKKAYKSYGLSKGTGSPPKMGGISPSKKMGSGSRCIR
jgi:hypothetical protein